ncbi:FtsW/RodA/SpoVE family cell cycle protein [Cellulomonas bogoriensis]|uniref:Cell division protein n=1 Tax=Cellulomonas bogoriensis 69B4 = DSM 16987 TaxID=1386082 RepID=A0A0A0C353_9CELL|nr:FtsW/RodA/SpoVE family cell cycle protein [Cellulomonas bogoriensis]KGM13754.1 cell division protein [Cellulomonas bogoriensis 69B4 = DSM 16987]
MATVLTQPARSSRTLELWLLALALAVGVGAYALVGMAMEDSIPPDIVGYSAGLIGLSVGLHLVLRWRAPYADPVLLPVVVGLNGIGLAMIYRLDASYGTADAPSTFAERQLAWTALGVVMAALVLIVLRDHRTLRRYTYTAMLVGLLLLVLPLVPHLGVEINGARIWIRIGDNSLQPAEFAKIALAVFFAGYLVTMRDTLALAGPKVMGLQLPRPRDLGPILLAWAASLAVLVFQRDLGTSLLFFGLFVGMLYLATERISWVVIGLGLFMGGALTAAQVFPHVAGRFNGWLNAYDNEVFNAAFGGSGQLVRGLFGMANGGLFGTGWGQGYPQLVPYAESDFIIPSLGEELGLTGLLAILVCYLVLAERGLRTAVGVRDGFGKLFAGGMSFVIAFQCFVVVGGVTRLIPLTGLTMPFMAYGGSSLLANWMIVALLLRISDSARRPAPPSSPVPDAPSDDSPIVVGGRDGGGRDSDGRGVEASDNETVQLGVGEVRP